MKLKNIFTVFVIFCWCNIFYFAIVTSIPYNPMTLNKNLSFKIKIFLPEGWNFFTRNPREIRTYIYCIDNYGTIYPLPNWPNNSFNNLMGIKRTARAIGTDYGMILSNIPDSLWSKSTEIELNKKNSKNFFTGRPIFQSYPDGHKKHFLFGNLLFVQKEILPWSWYRSNITANLPLKYLHVFIEYN